MAKKKKHRNKSRKQRNRAALVNQPVVQVDEDQDNAVKKTTITASTKLKPVSTTPETTYDDVELGYVKTDIKKTLILVGLILAVYFLLWILMTYTQFGNSSIKLLGR